MPKTINRAPKTPRKIRDIRPKRQQRNNEKKGGDTVDEWWYSANDTDGDGEGRQSHLRRGRFKRSFGKDAVTNAEPTNAKIHTRRRAYVLAILKSAYENIRQKPRRKRLFWGLIFIPGKFGSIFFSNG